MQQKPMTRPWTEIQRTYEELTSNGLRLNEMVRLIAQIQQSRLHHLFGWTSMHDLCIAQTKAVYPYDGPFLRISPRFDGTLEFRYCDTPIKEAQWQRIVPEADAFNMLEHFADELLWFTQRQEC